MLFYDTKLSYVSIVTHKIEDDNPKFILCIDDICRKLENMGPIIDNNEAMRCEYISTILHTAVAITKHEILKSIQITPQADVSSEENVGRVDYAISAIRRWFYELLCITEAKKHQKDVGICQNLLQCRSACYVSLYNFSVAEWLCIIYIIF